MLCGDKHNTVTSTGTVEGGSAGILEDLHVFDIVRVDVRKATTNLTVDNDKRFIGTSIKVTATTHSDRRCGRRRTGSYVHTNTGHSTHKSLSRVGVSADGKSLFANLGDRVGHIGALLLYAIAHHNHLVEHIGIIFLKHDIEGLTLPSHGYGFVADEVDGNLSSVGHTF